MAKKRFEIGKANLEQPVNTGTGNNVATLEPANDGKTYSPLYYNMNTLEPLPLEVIEKRIDKNFTSIDRSLSQIALDLYVVHENWTSKYNRNDSWQKWMKDHVKYDRSYVYDLLKIVRAIKEHAENSRSIGGRDEAEDYDNLLTIIQNPLEKYNIQTLKYAAQVEDPERRAEVFEAILSGEELSNEKILKINRDKSVSPEKARGLETTVINEASQSSGRDLNVTEAMPVQDPVLFTVEKGGFSVYFLRSGELWATSNTAVDGRTLESRIGVFDENVDEDFIKHLAETALVELVRKKGIIWK
jgi:hypothetical protein